MPEPLVRSELSDGPLADAAQRLDRALARLEAALDGAGRPATPPRANPAEVAELWAANAALSGELGESRRRGRRLKAAAAGASEAVGRAAEEVRKALDEDAAAQGLLAFALESRDASGDEPSTDGRPETAEETTA